MLFIVPTPIGNLKDITLRALDALKEADAVFCEDTRRTLNLLNHFGISKKLFRYNEHDERSVAGAMAWLRSGKSAALVTDGGSPCISDPGRKLVALARSTGIKVTALPGPSAVITAAAGSGLPCDSFVFLGFLPRSRGKIVKALAAAFTLNKTVILFESPYRLKKFLAMAREEFGPGLTALVAREISKIYEEWTGGLIDETIAKIEAAGEVKGEIVLLLRPPEAAEDEADDEPGQPGDLP
ncbi:MAG TPA: 16S rRNA (cytidine(1402)-2'-O)-methyltransferase [Elusimicrobia bacterium]|nr:MAG: 16S rRNA (cytidine(1402)-2'-O)-methyltransferase [Elusimicrobia bacterium GWB2_63_16]HAN04428.1 16S rRNA (cytidine(1402)-2'-O)-methyltransferase [Elusimicrobiota bacterium]HAU89791.1 16S rRNA (cytidine(1402)-2'-O)-methyltransferase [Elusimicrobiota bacterium]